MRPGRDFFPLAVHYVEKAYSVGKIPGGFFKREARPSEKETLTSRLIDRPIRPLFPNGFMNEVQVVCTVVSADKHIDPDIPAMIGTSAALAISGAPFNGPIGGARVGFTDADGYILNPTYPQLADSKLNMVVAGTEAAVLMVESEADELSEDQMLGAVLYAHQEMQVVIQAIKDLASEAGKPSWNWEAEAVNEELLSSVEGQVKVDLGEAYRITEKSDRYERVGEIRNACVEALATEVMPNSEEFPYTVRIVSEITESNGSSSMASVCAGSLGMMAAGVPLKAPVAGIAMGLVKDGNQFAVLTDILGDEDHLGDMDFKVAGTAGGITALQMDIKIEGINEQIMETALSQALEARLHILGQMNQVLSTAREVTSDNAPSMIIMKVDSDKIRDIIGKGGAMIRSITEQSGATVDIDDDGTVRVFGQDKASRDAAVVLIETITADAEVGAVYTGTVARIVDFGAFVNILPGKDGLVHISQIANERVENVTDHLSEGQEVQVKVLDVDQRGRIKLSIKELLEDEAPAAEAASE
ncbi:UNVERIFIED_CONTAM: hypothetical protein GTU68_047319 [Idotea baltica]|nr:hypothetical protein [Idotea baltica]